MTCVCPLNGPIRALPGVDADGDETVVAGALQPSRGDVPKRLFGCRWCPHERGAVITLALSRAVDAVGPLERWVLTRLHIDPAEWNLRLPGADAEDLRLVEPDVRVEVAHLH